MDALEAKAAPLRNAAHFEASYSLETIEKRHEYDTKMNRAYCLLVIKKLEQLVAQADKLKKLNIWKLWHEIQPYNCTAVTNKFWWTMLSLYNVAILKDSKVLTHFFNLEQRAILEKCADSKDLVATVFWEGFT